MSPVGVSFLFFFYFYFTVGRSLEITMSIGSVSRVLQLIGSLSDKWSWSQAPVLAGVHPAAMSLNRMLNLEFAMSLLSPRRDERECNRVLPQFTRIFISVNQILIYLSGLQGATIVVAHATKNCQVQLNIFICHT